MTRLVADTASFLGLNFSPAGVAVSDFVSIATSCFLQHFKLRFLGVPLRVGLSATNGKGHSARFAKPLVFLRIRCEPPPPKLN